MTFLGWLMATEMYKAAIYYKRRGFSVIPVGKNKKPVIAWQKYQNEYATDEELKVWFGDNSKNNIAIVTGILSNLSVIDIDDEIEAKPVLDKLIPDSLDIPLSETPSGGKHLYFKCTSIKLCNNTRIVPGADLRANGGYIIAPPSTNYKWICGEGDPLPELPKAYLDYIKINSVKKQKHEIVKTKIKYFDKGRRDTDLFTIANSLIKDNANPDFVAEILKRLINSWGETDEKWINDKINSALNREEKHHENLQEEIKEYILHTTGEFNINELDREMNLKIKQEKKNRTVILSRLCKEGFIEKIGKRTGTYRLVIIDENVIDWKSASTEKAVNIKLIFNIHELVNLYPKNIVVIAGEKSAGKTALLLNLVKDNMKNHKIYYFSSEMVEMEMKSRLEKFKIDQEEWDFIPISRSRDFHDVIRPDDINVVDFLEIHDGEFFLIADMIRKIYDKLDKGIAIIGIQKKAGTDYGRGAEFSMEKARLYISLEAGNKDKDSILKIVDAKNWKPGIKNPRGNTYTYKLYNGCEFIPTNLIKNALQHEKEQKHKESYYYE